VAQSYLTATAYVAHTRLMLQDTIAPYRYPDDTIIRALNLGLDEMARIRPDIYLDLKYSAPLRKGDIDDGNPGPYALTDIVVAGDGTYTVGKGTLVPVPNKYRGAIEWFMPGWCQMLDYTDTQDARGQGFMQKFQTHMLTLTSA
jgi:hypothetical protein